MTLAAAAGQANATATTGAVDPLDPTTWRWPVFPGHFEIYDKYADTKVSLGADAEQWGIPIQGRIETFKFRRGLHGRLQRGLIILTQCDRSPSTVKQFTRSLLNKWPLYYDMLRKGPDLIHRIWQDQVNDIDTAKAGKAILKLACSVSVGPWQAKHLSMIKSLDCRARRIVLAQRSRVIRREPLLSIDAQSALIRVLDESAITEDLTAAELEGLAALALMYQHGVRPVQVISLQIQHIRVLRDASGETVCVVSFHRAKQIDGGGEEMPRQMKPEWACLIERLLLHARTVGRNRLFCSSTSQHLWASVKKVCKRYGVNFGYTAGALRHTAAQSLADAGHSRYNIQKFLGHQRLYAAKDYMTASRQQAELINSALGVSKLYGAIVSLADRKYISVEEMERASDDQQIGAVVGDRLVAGVGLCKSGQPACPYNPVTSCYGCRKFWPSLNRASHLEAIAGMREAISRFIERGVNSESTAYLQLMGALAGAQQALADVDLLETLSNQSRKNADESGLKSASNMQ